MIPRRFAPRRATRRTSPGRLVVVALIAGLVGCASGRPPPGAPPPDLRDDTIERGRIASRLHVLGTVHDRQGNPVIGAAVRVHAHPRPRCIGGRGAFGTVRVRDDGWFMKTLYFYSLPSTPSCVVVSVTPPSGSTLMPDSVSDLMSEFRHGAEVDTVLVRMTLHRGRR
ncbi:MAG: hypothetical protein R3195_11200 [Gemmatimonadota bacterium]|nr:hypothetical protein [Gemmatimonadota bacterium]